jgi:hypothetical protein
VASVPCLGCALRPGFSRCSALAFLDAFVIGTPIDDALLDGLRFQVVGESFAEERGELVIRGETEGDELLCRELVDVSAFFDGQERLEAKTLLEADDAVLHDEGAVAGYASHDEQDEGQNDPPEMGVLVARPVVHGGVDGEDEVEQKQGQNEEMKRRMPAHMIFEALLGGH